MDARSHWSLRPTRSRQGAAGGGEGEALASRRGLPGLAAESSPRAGVVGSGVTSRGNRLTSPRTVVLGVVRLGLEARPGRVQGPCPYWSIVLVSLSGRAGRSQSLVWGTVTPTCLCPQAWWASSKDP